MKVAWSAQRRLPQALAAALLSGALLEPCTAADPSISVTAVGPDSFAIGKVSGGTVNIGISQSIVIGMVTGGTVNLVLSSQEARQLAKATTIEAGKFLKLVVKRTNDQAVVKESNQTVSLELVQRFLSTVKGKKISVNDWPETFAELTTKYLEMGDQIRNQKRQADAQDKVLQKFLDGAERARLRGDFVEADRLINNALGPAMGAYLKQYAKAKAEDAKAKLLARSAANILTLKASNALVQLNRAQAAMLYEKAFELVKDDADYEVFDWMLKALNARIDLGQFNEASQISIRLRTLAQSKLAATPDDNAWAFRSVLASFSAAVLRTTGGDNSLIKKAAQDCIDTTARSLERAPNNPSNLRILSMCHASLGVAILNEGDSDGAIENIQKAIAIAKKSADQDADDDGWRLPLANALSNLAFAAMRQGNSDEAQQSLFAAADIIANMKSRPMVIMRKAPMMAQISSSLRWVMAERKDFRNSVKMGAAALETWKSLSELDQSNMQWKTQVLLSHIALSEGQVELGELELASQNAASAYSIAKEIRNVYPDDENWQVRFIQAALTNGNILMRRNEPRQALKVITDAIQASASTVSRTPRDLNIGLWYLMSQSLAGSIHFNLGEVNEARARFKLALRFAAEPGSVETGSDTGKIMVAGTMLLLYRTIPLDQQREREKILADGNALLNTVQGDGVTRPKLEELRSFFKKEEKGATAIFH